MYNRLYKHLLVQSLIFFSTAFTSCFSTVTAAEKPFSVAFNKSWPPFSYRNDHNQMEGILVDIVKEVFETKLNRPVELYGYPWKRVQYNVEIGVHDGFISTATEQRLSYSVRSSEPVYTLEERAFISKSSKHKLSLSRLKPENLAILKNHKVCDMIGNGWADTFYGAQNIKIKRFKDINLCFRNVAFERFDIVIHVSAAGLSLLKREGLDDRIEMLPTTFDKVPFPLLMSKKSKHLDLLPRFDQAIREFKHEGGIQRIVDRYTQ